MPISFDLVRQQWQRKLIIIAAIAIGIAMVMASRPYSSEGNLLHEAVERSGFFLILIAIVGRTWCSMYIGGRKLEALVTNGPYSVSRNPLYVFSSIAAFGVAAQFGSIIIAAICAASCLAIFRLVVSHEETALAVRFPVEFPTYRARVPRFLPDPCLWQDADTILVRPALVTRTFWDAMLFLLAAIAMKGVESLRDNLPIGPLLHLY
ncbi:MAG: isoprenylcysteine carboxylmethyltransferase family protein [Pseudorhodoplanes sp.]